MEIEFKINGEKVKIDVSPKKRLLDILREDLRLTGTKEGCGKGECGACTVLLNGERVNSCPVPALQLPGSSVVTVEGLRRWKSYPAIERAYLEHGAVQCGFCMTGFAMSTVALLKEQSFPLTREEIKWGLGGNLCRCTGYSKILDAVEEIVDRKDIREQVEEDWQYES